MPEYKAIKSTEQFLSAWSVLNLIGWIIGFCFVFLIHSNFEYDNKFSAWKEFLLWLPLGAGVGLLQWVKLRRLSINLFVWVFVTALGYSILVVLFLGVLNVYSFDYGEYNIPHWVINIGLATTVPIGGLIIGCIQSLVIKKHILRPDLWVRAYTVGLLVPTIAVPIAELVKSFILEFLYSVELYILVDMRWFLFFGFLIIITAIVISKLTGDILLKHSNINSAKIQAG